MSPLGLILIVVLIALLAGGGYGYRTGGWYVGPPYGYGFGLVGIVLIVLVVLLLTGRL
jgi:hypothetical protein